MAGWSGLARAQARTISGMGVKEVSSMAAIAGNIATRSPVVDVEDSLGRATADIIIFVSFVSNPIRFFPEPPVRQAWQRRLYRRRPRLNEIIAKSQCSS